MTMKLPTILTRVLLPSTLALPTLVLLTTGCQGSDDPRGSCPAGVGPGDLVITEIMANPPGTDKGAEWFEIHNGTGDTVDLTGTELISRKGDGTGERTHTMGELSVGPGEYVVVGNCAAETQPPHVDYCFGDELGDRGQDDGQLEISCGGTVDLVTYINSTDSASRGFDGALAPDASANDLLENWCDGATPQGDGDAAFFGTPGAQNDGCGAPTECMDPDSGELRPLAPLEVGCLAFSEVMADPSAVGDTDGEWFELTVLCDVDINGLQFATDPDSPEGSLQGDTCLSYGEGDRILVVRNEDMATNGGLPEHDFTTGLSLTNSGGTLYAILDGEIIDEAAYASGAGTAYNLSVDQVDADANDVVENWCDADTPYGDGDLGTPGAENIQCPITAPEGQCDDQGELRDIVAPAYGDLVISEFHANPDAVGDSEGEWFELHATADVDLNDLAIGKLFEDGPEETIESGPCLSVQAGETVLLVKNADTGTNGGLPGAVWEFGFSVTNSSSGLFVASGDVLVDQITYGSTEAGIATQLSGASLDADANDDDANWCPASSPYGDGDLGTPGMTNPACPGEGDCLDGGRPRPAVNPAAGELVINEFMANPEAVSDGDGEWIEVFVDSGGDIDLNGVVLGRGVDWQDPDNTQLIESQVCLTVSPGDYVLFAKDLDSGVNGGLPEVDYELSWSVTNSDNGIYLEIDGELIDFVGYQSVFAGSATSLDPDFQDAADNDDAAVNWCEAPNPYGDGDNGSPKAENPQCG